MKKPLHNFERKKRFVRLILQQSGTIEQLAKQIRCHSLTDALNILENSGCTGDLAVFILANFQALERENCHLCGGELGLKVTCDACGGRSHRQTKSRYLSAGWCDFCLSPWDVWGRRSDRSDHLLRSRNLTLETTFICPRRTDSADELRSANLQSLEVGI